MYFLVLEVGGLRLESRDLIYHLISFGYPSTRISQPSQPPNHWLNPPGNSFVLVWSVYTLYVPFLF